MQTKGGFHERRVRFSVAMSLDGYIAGPNGESDWILMDPDIDFSALMSAFDTVLLGRKTYEATRQQGGTGGMPGMQAYLFSSTLRQTECPGVIVSDNPAKTLAELKAKRGKTFGYSAAACCSAACSSLAWSMQWRLL
ncbi:MAG: dihydrofolate reductase family protein [Acidobacteria bacterium]|nr:dihydrofolate reductase family protein [Acidobacteriota bacterium]